MEGIKAGDLRIGNLVRFNDGVFPVSTIGETTFSYIDSNQRKAVLHKGVFGVPLTEEWLKRFGLKLEHTLTFESGYNSSSNIQKYYTNTIFNLEDEIKFQVVVVIGKEHGELRRIGIVDAPFYSCGNIRFVHDLQNKIYHLTGTDLTTNP